MIIVASTNARIGFAAGMGRLRAVGSALDAVEAAIRLVESNPEDHSVGYSGLPNLLGEVELDSSIMDGRTRAAGAVGALKGYEHAISVARRVMEELPHVMLVGDGAARFADEFGYLVCRVDIRGTGSSEGTAAGEYTRDELEDLAELVGWLAERPWSNGNVGMYGTSWSGFNALQTAMLRPPALKAICSIFASDDRYADDVHYFGGALKQLDLDFVA